MKLSVLLEKAKIDTIVYDSICTVLSLWLRTVFFWLLDLKIPNLNTCLKLGFVCDRIVFVG